MQWPAVAASKHACFTLIHSRAAIPCCTSACHCPAVLQDFKAQEAIQAYAFWRLPDSYLATHEACAMNAGTHQAHAHNQSTMLPCSSKPVLQYQRDTSAMQAQTCQPRQTVSKAPFWRASSIVWRSVCFPSGTGRSRSCCVCNAASVTTQEVAGSFVAAHPRHLQNWQQRYGRLQMLARKAQLVPFMLTSRKLVLAGYLHHVQTTKSCLHPARLLEQLCSQCGAPVSFANAALPPAEPVTITP